MTDNNEILAQVMRILDEPGSEPYTLRPDDIQACRDILRRLLADDQITGGYGIGSVQGYKGKAQVMIEFAKSCDAWTAAEIAARTADSSNRLGTLCRKVIAHYDTNHERMQKLEEFYAALKEFDKYLEEDCPEAVADRLYDAREALRETTGEHPVIECNRPAHQDGHHGPECYGPSVVNWTEPRK